MIASSQGCRRIILLLGAPRSGTSWLANILNSHPGVLYSHEPLGKLHLAHLSPVTRRLVREGTLTRAELNLLIDEWIRAHPVHRRPPFFAKDFQATPPRVMKVAWALLQRFRPGRALFRMLYSPCESKRFDLLIKEVDWAPQAEKIVGGLDPELIFIIRHPCAVVASELRGIERGLMPRRDRECWIQGLEPVLKELGHDERTILALDDMEWLTLCWMVANRVYQRIAASRPRSHFVVYEELCRDPMGVTRRVFDFLNWPMGPQTVTFLDHSTREASSLGTVLRGNQPYFGIYRDSAESADKWKTALPPKQRDRVLEMVRPYFPGYGNQNLLEPARINDQKPVDALRV